MGEGLRIGQICYSLLRQFLMAFYRACFEYLLEFTQCNSLVTRHSASHVLLSEHRLQ